MNIKSIVKRILSPPDSDISDKIIIDGISSNFDGESKLGKAISYGGTNSDNSITKREVNFTPPEYDLENIEALYDIEAYFRQFVEKIVQRIFNQNFQIVGDDKAVKYIKQRIEILENNMNMTFEDFLENISRELIRYCNVFIEKIRNRRAPKRYWTVYRKRLLPPVVKYQIVEAPRMRIAVSQHGRILRYLQLINNVFQTDQIFSNYDWNTASFPNWAPYDMIHIAVDKKPQHQYGTPIVLPVIDDIKGLRQEEEAGEIIVFQFAKPILVFKVAGSNRRPTESDIDEANNALSSMASYGYLATSIDNELEYVGANKSAIDISPYLNYLRKRIWEGLGIDPITMGESNSSNRNTAQSMTESMIYLVKFYQRKLKKAIEWNIFKEWKKEGSVTGNVHLFFPEIDLTSLERKELHYLQMFQGNAITHAELRKEIGRQPLENDDDLFANRFGWEYEKKEATLSSNNPNQKVDLSKQNKKQSKKIASQTIPQNQYGKKPRPKIKKD